MDIMKTKNLIMKYGKEGNTIFAVNDVSLSVKTGEFISIIGPSGSGKSTLLHILGCVNNPTSGEVLLDNINIYNLNDEEQSKLRREKIGLVYQFYNLIPTLNVRENIILPLKLDDKEINNEYFDSLVKFLKLNDRLTHYPSELSGGEQQRVAIARALIIRPSILLADEPTGNLDSKNSLEIINIFKVLNAKLNQTIIMVTHDDMLSRFAKRRITIVDGKIIEDEVLNEND